MNEEKFILSPSECPSWFVYPHSFRRMVNQGLVHITPWHLMDAQRALLYIQGLTKRYPLRNLFPFAYRQDNDDVACWAKHMGEKVFIIHDFATAGYEDEGVFEDTWLWFRSAVDETISWD